MPPRTHRAERTAQAARGVAFSSFFERNALRENRRRSRRNTLMVSLAVHAVALLTLVVYSLWHVDEMWTPSVGVKVMSRKDAPPAAAALVDPSLLSDPPLAPR